MPQNTKAFKENLSAIYDELHLAKQWGKASIILTVHKSSLSQEKTKEVLRNELGTYGYSLVDVEINKIEGNFIEYMLQQENIENIVFCISNIDWGGGKDEKDGYRTLNLYRETFIEKKIKAIFFLTAREDANLPKYAPDFWAFRHRVLGFVSPRGRGKKHLPVGLMLWHSENAISSIRDIQNKITGLLKLLNEMPDKAESISTRVDLHYELGYLYWQLGDLTNAKMTFTNGVELAQAHSLQNSLVKTQNGLAIILYELGTYRNAWELLGSIIDEYPRDCLLIINQAVALFAMKKRYDAILKGKKAVSICDHNSRVWNSLGFIHYYAGNKDDAIACFKKAIHLSSRIGYYYESLSLCYKYIGLTDKANDQLDLAQDFSASRKAIQSVLKEYIKGNSANTLKHLGAMISTGKLRKLNVERDPILNIMAATRKANQF